MALEYRFTKVALETLAAQSAAPTARVALVGIEVLRSTAYSATASFSPSARVQTVT